MNKNTIIGILVVVIILIGGYAIFKTFEKPAQVVQVIDNSQNQALNQNQQNNPSAPVVPNTSQANSQLPAPSVNTYTDNQNHFQIDLPKGVSVMFSNQLAGGTSLQMTTHYGVPGLHNIDISNTPCVSSNNPVNVTINGISFIKTAGSGAFGGMESGSIDMSYCATHNGKGYTFSFTDQYNRVNGSPAPDTAATYQEFDQQMQALNFSFL
jgi:hypothetical protein